VASNETDWRIMGQDKFLQNVTLIHREYRRPRMNPNWDHDHCEFCSARFMVEDYPDVLHRGYATENDYHWICENCFNDFKESFNWTVIENLE
jgi:hypothetical protein